MALLDLAIVNPFAKGQKVICKHMAATYFTQFPQEIEEQNEIIDTQRQEREQEVKVYMLPLEWLEEVELNSKQVQAFSFMLECEDEEV